MSHQTPSKRPSSAVWRGTGRQWLSVDPQQCPRPELETCVCVEDPERQDVQSGELWVMYQLCSLVIQIQGCDVVRNFAVPDQA